MWFVPQSLLMLSIDSTEEEKEINKYSCHFHLKFEEENSLLCDVKSTVCLVVMPKD